MAYDEILYNVADAVATLSLNRPTRLDAWTPTMEKEVQEAMLTAARDERMRVIVLTGAGRGFCAGADMGNLDGLAKSNNASGTLEQLSDHFAGPRIEGARTDFQKTYSYFPAIGKPIIGAINGAAAGLGFVISLYCDIRIASDQAKFTTSFAAAWTDRRIWHGLDTPTAGRHFQCIDLLYSARLIHAAEALEMGLVSRVIPADTFAAEVHKYAAAPASASSPRSMCVIKRQVYEGLLTNLAEAVDLANQEMLESLVSEDFTAPRRSPRTRNYVLEPDDCRNGGNARARGDSTTVGFVSSNWNIRSVPPMLSSICKCTRLSFFTGSYNMNRPSPMLTSSLPFTCTWYAYRNAAIPPNPDTTSITGDDNARARITRIRWVNTSRRSFRKSAASRSSMLNALMTRKPTIASCNTANSDAWFSCDARLALRVLRPNIVIGIRQIGNRISAAAVSLQSVYTNHASTGSVPQAV